MTAPYQLNIKDQVEALAAALSLEPAEILIVFAAAIWIVSPV